MKSIVSGSAASNRALLFVGVAAASLMLPTAAYAQKEEEAKAAPAKAVDATEADGNEIVVTATKREQTLQDVPVAVTVTTAETIERAQIRDIRDLSSVVPSLRVNQLQSSGNTNFYIRGFGNGANNAGIEPSVGLFVDGVYRSRSASMIGDLPDVQRIEVLRGPQSTLFGKNASAGIISIVTKAPQFKFGGNVEASYGNYNAVVLKGVVTGPLSETVAASLAAGYNRRDGYVTDLNTGSKVNARNRYFVRGQLLFEPSSDLKVRLIGDYSKIDEVCCAVVNLRRSAASGAIIALGGKLTDPTTPFADVTYNNFDSTNKIDNWGLSGQIDANLGPVKLTSITAYRKSHSITNQDSDFTSFDLLGKNAADVNIDTFTQELRFSSNWDGPFSVLAGAFYFNEKVNQTGAIDYGTGFRSFANLSIQQASGGALNVGGGAFGSDLETTFGTLEGNPTKYTGQFFKAGRVFTENANLKDEAFTLFAQADFKVMDRLTFTGGVSYTHDKKDFVTNDVSSEAFSAIDLDAAAYAPFRNALIKNGAIAQQVGTALGLGRSASVAEITAFATGTSAAGAAGATAYATQIVPGATAFANANQNNPAANPLAGLKGPLQLVPPFLNVPNALETGKLSDGHWNWTARLAFDVTEGVNAYLSFATGYKAASVNLSRDSRPTAADLTSISTNAAYAALRLTNLGSGSRYALPEESTVYEAGVKAKWATGNVNIAVFKQTIKGFQSNIFTGTGFFLANAGKQSVRGVEFEGNFKPIPELTLSLAMTYLDPKYDEFKLSAFGDLSGTMPAGVTQFATVLGMQWNHEFGNGDRLILHADYRHEDKFRLVEGLPGLVVKNSAGVVTSTAAALQAATDFAQTINNVDASITYALGSGPEFTIWGRNVLNKRTILQIFDSPAQSGSISGYPSEPRTYGVSARYRF